MLHANGKYTRHEQKSLNLHGYGGKKERTWLLLEDLTKKISYTHLCFLFKMSCSIIFTNTILVYY